MTLSFNSISILTKFQCPTKLQCATYFKRRIATDGKSPIIVPYLTLKRLVVRSFHIGSRFCYFIYIGVLLFSRVSSVSSIDPCRMVNSNTNISVYKEHAFYHSSFQFFHLVRRGSFEGRTRQVSGEKRNTHFIKYGLEEN